MRLHGEDQVFEVGDLLAIETGCYSDFGVEGPARVIRRFSKQEAADRFVGFKRAPRYHGDTCRPDPSDFLAWLVTEGYVEHVDRSFRWHVGSYLRFEP